VIELFSNVEIHLQPKPMRHPDRFQQAVLPAGTILTPWP